MPSERKQLNIRLSDSAWAALHALVAATGLSQADLVMQGLRLLARREQIPTETKAGKSKKSP